MPEAVLAKIPAFPTIVLRVLDVLSQDNAKVSELTELIDSDIVFSAQILKVANSPLFGFRAQIDSIQRAIVALGLSRIQALTLSVATANYMKAALKTDELHRCWRHTLASAVICRELARACALPEDRAYTAGLLHDIGRLGLLVAYPNEYSAVLKAAARTPQPILKQERDFFGMDHCEAGKYLVEQWNLPQEFRLTVSQHHEKPSAKVLDLLTIACLGCRMADVLGYFVVKPAPAASFESLCKTLSPSAAQRFPVQEGELRALVDRVIEAHDPASIETESRGSQGHANGRDREEDRKTPPEPAVVTPIFAVRASEMTWDFTIVGTTVLIFVTVFVAFSYFWSS